MVRGRARSTIRGSIPLNSEINVTPFVDVMLVLLVIFIVAAPMMTVGVPVDLPRASLQELPPEDQPIEVFIKADGAIHLGERPVAIDALAAELLLLPVERRSQRVRVRADREVPYEQVMAVIEALSGHGFSRLGLVAAPRQEAATP